MRPERTIAERLVLIERGRGKKAESAWSDIARKLRIGAGTFERIVRGRAKRIDSSIRDRLEALLVRELDTEIKRLAHELEMARQGGVGLDRQQIGAIEAHLAKAAEMIAEARR